jgi:hypothetical protein
MRLVYRLIGEALEHILLAIVSVDNIMNHPTYSKPAFWRAVNRLGRAATILGELNGTQFRVSFYWPWVGVSEAISDTERERQIEEFFQRHPMNTPVARKVH